MFIKVKQNTKINYLETQNPKLTAEGMVQNAQERIFFLIPQRQSDISWINTPQCYFLPILIFRKSQK